MFSSDLTEGSSVQVLCGVSSGDKPMYFSWQKDSAPLPPSLQVEEKNLNEFSLLMFSELSAAHSGAYTCRVTNHASAVNYTATLTVNVAPVWTTEPTDAAVVLGAPLLLRCAASGHPAPTAVWYRNIGDDGGPGTESERWQAVDGGAGGAWGAAGGLHAAAGGLHAEAAARVHQGLYRCVADNGVGPPLLKHVNVTVHEPAHFEEGGGNVSCVRGRSVALTCLALGDAPLSVHWTHRGRRLDLDSYRWSVSEARAGRGLRSTLTLRAAERGDGGEYRCHARNAHGAADLPLHLLVQEPPAAPRALRLAGLGARWVRLAWRPTPGAVDLRYTALCLPLHALPGADPVHGALNLTLNAETDVDDGAGAGAERVVLARVASLRPAVTYSLRLAAANLVGHSPYSEPLVFTTLEEAPAGSPLNVRARPVGSGELHVAWAAPPRDGWNGELLGFVASWRELEPAAGAGAAPGGGRLTAPGGGSTELTLGGLRGGARFALAVRAYNRAGAGPPSPLLYATTADGGIVLAGGAAIVGHVRGGECALAARALVAAADARARAARLRHTVRSPGPVRLAGRAGGRERQRARRHRRPGHAAGTRAQHQLLGVGPRARRRRPRPTLAAHLLRHAGGRAGRGAGGARAGSGCGRGARHVAGARAARRTTHALHAVHARTRQVCALFHAVCSVGGARTSVSHVMLCVAARTGGERAQRVEAAPGEEEVWREVRGLRPVAYEAWVQAAAARGVGPPSPPVTVAPAHAGPARISSLGRAVLAARGARVRLPCAAVGAPPVRRRWHPLPPHHSLADSGDLVIPEVRTSSGGNYTCSVRNAGGADVAVFTLAVASEPAAPAAPRLVRADTAALHLAWDAPSDGGAPLLGYTVAWARDSADAAEGAGQAHVPAHDATLTLARLACGARYRVTLQAHNAVGASPHSAPLTARTRGDKAAAAPGEEFVWANGSALRLNLLAWRARCPVAAWSVSLRPASGGGGPWRDLPADGESAAAGGLRTASWYEVRVVARSPAGDTAALYRAPTRALSGERIGDTVEVTVEARSGGAEGAGGAGGASGAWRAGAGAALLLGGGAAALAAALGGAALARRGAVSCLRRECTPRHACAPHPQLYTTEPSKRNGKALSPPDAGGDTAAPGGGVRWSDESRVAGEPEISPYATFSMLAGGGGEAGGGGCALHLRTFGRAEPELAAAPPPPRPNLLAHHEYGRGRSSDSESSGSPCAACARAARLYHGPPPPPAPAPAPLRPDTLPLESSAEDTSYSTRPSPSSRAGRLCSARGVRGERGGRQPAHGSRRREHARHASGPTLRSRAAVERRHRGRAAAVAAAAAAACAAPPRD